MAFSIDMDKALAAASQALVDEVRADHGLEPMPFEKLPRIDQVTWQKRALKALDAAIPFIK